MGKGLRLNPDDECIVGAIRPMCVAQGQAQCEFVRLFCSCSCGSAPSRRHGAACSSPRELGCSPPAPVAPAYHAPAPAGGDRGRRRPISDARSLLTRPRPGDTDQKMGPPDWLIVQALEIELSLTSPTPSNQKRGNVAWLSAPSRASSLTHYPCENSFWLNPKRKIRSNRNNGPTKQQIQTQLMARDG